MAEEKDVKEERATYGSSEQIVTDGGDLEGGEGLKDNYALEGNKVDDFYAAGQEYRQYANKTDKPVWTDEERKTLRLDAKESEEKEEPKAPSTPATPLAPPATK